jgi:hypothetical protein
MGLRELIRDEYRDQFVECLSKRSVMATKICVLASHLFLYRMKLCYETGSTSFHEDDGSDIIKRCFYAVLHKNKEKENMGPEFRAFFEGLDAEHRTAWPNNDNFGNSFKYLIRMYVTNVENNLNTHAKARCRQYLRVRAMEFNFENENVPDAELFDETDIKNTINWMFSEYDSVRGEPVRHDKRRLLMNYIREATGLTYDTNLKRFTTVHWYQSIRMWLWMQDYVAQFKRWANDEHIQIPKINILSVIPLCSYQRKHIEVDTHVLYRMTSNLKLLPKAKSNPMRWGSTVDEDEFFERRDEMWQHFINFEKIESILKKKRKFLSRIITDGVSATIIFSIPKREFVQLDENIRRIYLNGFFIYELGIDPGMKTWNATVRRTIATKKEVF